MYWYFNLSPARHICRGPGQGQNGGRASFQQSCSTLRLHTPPSSGTGTKGRSRRKVNIFISIDLFDFLQSAAWPNILHACGRSATSWVVTQDWITDRRYSCSCVPPSFTTLHARGTECKINRSEKGSPCVNPLFMWRTKRLEDVRCATPRKKSSFCAVCSILKNNHFLFILVS